MIKVNLKPLAVGTLLAATPLLANAWGFNLDSDRDYYDGPNNSGSSWSWNSGNNNYRRPPPWAQRPPQQNQTAQQNRGTPQNQARQQNKTTQKNQTDQQSESKSTGTSSWNMDAPSFSFGNGWNRNNYNRYPNQWGPNRAYPPSYYQRYAPPPKPYYQPRFRPAWPQQPAQAPRPAPAAPAAPAAK